MMDTAAGGLIDNEFTKDVTSSVILQGLGEVLFAFVMAHEDDPRGMCEFLQQRLSASSNFSKAAVDSSLAQPRYNDGAMQNYIAK